MAVSVNLNDYDYSIISVKSDRLLEAPTFGNLCNLRMKLRFLG